MILISNTHTLLICSSYILITYFNISSIDINQCANNDVPFGGTHKCPNGTEVEIHFFFVASTYSFCMYFCFDSVFIKLDKVLH